jgi:hypothetical protein
MNDLTRREKAELILCFVGILAWLGVVAAIFLCRGR